MIKKFVCTASDGEDWNSLRGNSSPIPNSGWKSRVESDCFILTEENDVESDLGSLVNLSFGAGADDDKLMLKWLVTDRRYWNLINFSSCVKVY